MAYVTPTQQMLIATAKAVRCLIATTILASVAQRELGQLLNELNAAIARFEQEENNGPI